MRTLLVAAIFACSGLSAFSGTNLVSGVAITNIIAHKQELQGKRVEVKGYYWSGAEASQVSDGSDGGPIRATLFVHYGMVKPGCERNVKWFKKGPVRIIGTFNFRAGYPGPWPGEITDLEVFESTGEGLNKHLQPTPR
jgi:hypothetical protein